MKRGAAAVVVMGALGAPALAADGPSLECSKAKSSAEQLVCADVELAAVDRRLAEVYAGALAAAEGQDVEALDTLKATQRGWIGGRDECWKAEDLRACVEQAYLTREAELTAFWMLQEPTAVTRWICGGTPAEELYILFFDTPLPGLRVEYRGEIEAMHLSPAASGARYDGSFGRFFWEKGDEAILSWSEGTQMQCEQTE